MLLTDSYVLCKFSENMRNYAKPSWLQYVVKLKWAGTWHRLQSVAKPAEFIPWCWVPAVHQGNRVRTAYLLRHELVCTRSPDAVHVWIWYRQNWLRGWATLSTASHTVVLRAVLFSFAVHRHLLCITITISILFPFSKSFLLLIPISLNGNKLFPFLFQFPLMEITLQWTVSFCLTSDKHWSSLSQCCYIGLYKCCLSGIEMLTVSCDVFAAMHIAWRERNKDARIKAAKEILEKNPESVYFSVFFLLCLFLLTFGC